MLLVVLNMVALRAATVCQQQWARPLAASHPLVQVMDPVVLLNLQGLSTVVLKLLSLRLATGLRLLAVRLQQGVQTAISTGT